MIFIKKLKIIKNKLFKPKVIPVLEINNIKGYDNEEYIKMSMALISAAYDEIN